MALKLVLAGCAALALGGCAARPVPETVTKLNTYELVRKIRCETRDAVRGYAIAQIYKENRTLAEQFRSGEKQYFTGDRRGFPPKARAALDTYDGTVVAYDFTFDITQNNNVTASADFVRAFTRKGLDLGLTAKSEKRRKNSRNFRVLDSFDDLASDKFQKYCEDARYPGDPFYPITGKIGMEEQIGTFLDLNQSGNLGNRTSVDPNDTNVVPALADTVTFTTKLSGGINPTLKLMPIDRDFHLSEASLQFAADREDMHQVLIGISLPPDPEAEAEPEREPAPAAAPRSRAKRAASKAPAPGKRAIAKDQAQDLLDYQLYRNFGLQSQELRQRLEDALQE